MRKILLTLTSIICALACFIGVASFNKNVALAEGTQAKTDMTNVTDGIAFSDNGTKIEDRTYSLPTLTKTPVSFQFLFQAPNGNTASEGVLLGSYKNETDDAFGIEIATNGAPQIYVQKNGVIKYYHFDSSKVSDYSLTWNGSTDDAWVLNVFRANPNGSSTMDGDEYVNVNTGYMVLMGVIFNNETNQINLLVNGYFVASLNNVTLDLDFQPANNYVIGKDYSTEGNKAFAGKLKTVAIYSDVRATYEHHGDYVRTLISNENTYKPTTTSLKKLGGTTSLHLYDDELICAYDFTLGSDEYHKDLTGNGNNLTIVDNRAVTYAPSKNNGRKFVNDEQWTIAKDFSEVPHTFEAEIYLPQGYQARAGVILGNYDLYNTDCCFGFEIGTNGQAKVYVDNGATVFSKTLSNSDVRTGTWAHLTFVFDEANNEFRCYIDGALTDTVTDGYLTPVLDAINWTDLMIGGDYREGNVQSFKGRIRSIALFSDVRTAEEIAQDALSGFESSEEGLLAFYDINQINEENEVIKDLSNNGYDAKETMWLNEDEVAPVTDYAYSFAVIGDTQITNYYYHQNFASIYDWVLENAESQKIEFVFGLGDITDKNADFEFEAAVEQTKRLYAAGIPYAMVRGNHETNPKMNKYFDYKEYTDQFLGFYVKPDGSYDVANSYRTLEIGTTKYLILTLDYGAVDPILEWAGEICKQYYDHKVIVTTHAYSYSDKTTIDRNDKFCPPDNSGEDIWQKFASKYGNIYLILSGHVAYDNIIYYKSQGLQGNEVTQMLIDNQYTDKWHGGLGMVTMLYFSEDGSKITVRNYSPVRGQYFKPANQYELQMSTDVYENGCLHEAEAIVRDSAIKANATCHSSTEYYYSCECGEYIFEDRTFFGDDAWLAHNFGEYVYNNDATCLIPGTETAKCSYEGCNCVKVRVKIGSQTGHDFGEVVNGEHSCNTCGRTEAVEVQQSSVEPVASKNEVKGTFKSNNNVVAMSKAEAVKEEKGSGCASSMGIACPVLSVLALGGAFLFKKKQRNG